MLQHTICKWYVIVNRLNVNTYPKRVRKYPAQSVPKNTVRICITNSNYIDTCRQCHCYFLSAIMHTIWKPAKPFSLSCNVNSIIWIWSTRWGKCDIIEGIHLICLKHVLNFKKLFSSYMVYGKTGRFPLFVNIYTRMVSYWAKLFSGPKNKTLK